MALQQLVYLLVYYFALMSSGVMSHAASLSEASLADPALSASGVSSLARGRSRSSLVLSYLPMTRSEAREASEAARASADGSSLISSSHDLRYAALYCFT